MSSWNKSAVVTRAALWLYVRDQQGAIAQEVSSLFATAGRDIVLAL